MLKKIALKNLFFGLLLSSVVGIQFAHAEHKETAGEKQAIFVVGPGRCGTSCLMGVLEILGVCVGSDFATPAHNPKGIFEDRGVREKK